MIPTLRRHLSFILLHLQPRFTFIFPLVTPDPLLLSFIRALCSFLVKSCHYFPLTAENRPNLLPLTLLLPCQSHEQQSLLGFDLQSSQQLQPLLTASSSHHITSAFFCIPALTDCTVMTSLGGRSHWHHTEKTTSVWLTSSIPNYTTDNLMIVFVNRPTSEKPIYDTWCCRCRYYFEFVISYIWCEMQPRHLNWWQWIQESRFKLLWNSFVVDGESASISFPDGQNGMELQCSDTLKANSKHILIEENHFLSFVGQRKSNPVGITVTEGLESTWLSFMMSSLHLLTVALSSTSCICFRNYTRQHLLFIFKKDAFNIHTLVHLSSDELLQDHCRRVIV